MTEAVQPGATQIPDLLGIERRVNRIIRSTRSGLLHPGRPQLRGLAADAAFLVGARSRLYDISEQVAPFARDDERAELERRMHLRRGDKVVEIGAGTGFATRSIARLTGEVVYAVDTSPGQLAALSENTAGLRVEPIKGSFGDAGTLARLGDDVGQIDVATTLATFHHLVGEDEQERVFRNIGFALRPGGPFYGGDPGLGTNVQRFFDTVVEPNCITGHDKRWLSPEIIERDLIPGSGLVFVKAEVTENQKMRFGGENQMLLFIKSLLALDMKKNDLRQALGDILGFKKNADGQTELGWDLLYWEAVKPQT